MASATNMDDDDEEEVDIDLEDPEDVKVIEMEF